MPEGAVMSFHDQNIGLVEKVAQRDFGDFLVWNRDDVAAYELAVVADDMAMGITELVRGADLLTSTSRQILLYEALGSRPPAFFPVRSYATKKVGDSPSARAGFPFANSVKLAKPQRKF